MAKRVSLIRTTLKTVDFRTVQPMPKKADTFYLSAAWRGLMDRLYAERGRRCENCGRTSSRLFGDHIRELRDGGEPLDPSNIRILCGSCHQTKSAQARARRMAERY